MSRRPLAHTSDERDVGDGQFALQDRGVGFAECSANQIHSILGKLGRRRSNDPLASPRSCGSHRVVSVQRHGRFSSGRRF